MKILTVKVKAGRAVRKYQVVKSDGPNDLVFQSVKDGKPNPRRQHPDALHQTCSKEAGPWHKCGTRGHQQRWTLPAVRASESTASSRKAKHSSKNQLKSERNCSQLQPKSEMRDVQLIERMVARDGVEPPTPAFSGLRYA